MITMSMSERSLSHAPGSKECSLTFVASKTSKNVKSFPHVETITTTNRASKSDRCIRSRHLPPPVLQYDCYFSIRECRIKPWSKGRETK